MPERERERLDGVLAEMRAAAGRSGRDPGSVELMLVTKTVDASRIAPFVERGHRLFGENKVQEAKAKWGGGELAGYRPDFIGHLQTNKVKACLESCGRIHAVDRMGLVVALDRELRKRGEERDVFLQVNTSGEPSKFGVPPHEAVALAEAVSAYPSLRVAGLMTLAAFSTDPEKSRPCFRLLRSLREEVLRRRIFGPEFRHLSMGMSGDFGVAVEEGATIVRVGSAVFGHRSTPNSLYWPDHPSE